MKKLLSIFFVGALAVSVLAFAGCKKSDDGSTVKGKVNISQTSETTTQASKQESTGTTINWQSSQNSGSSQNSQTAQGSQTSQTSGAGATGLTQELQNVALAVYGEGEGTVSLNSQETRNGQTFYHVTVTYANGNSYPLVLTSDGVAMLPDDFESVFGGSSQDGNSDGDAGDNNEDYNEVEPYQESVDDQAYGDGEEGYNGYGPDGAQPY